MTTLVEFLRARLDEDEWWAREASRDAENPVPEAGHHWQWVDPDTDAVIKPDPAASAYLEDSDGASARVSLRSVETYLARSIDRELPHFAIHTAEEVPTTVAGHIIRHDPARVLAEVEAKRRIIERCTNAEPSDSGDIGKVLLAEYVLAELALPYADHPDYREEWKP